MEGNMLMEQHRRGVQEEHACFKPQGKTRRPKVSNPSKVVEAVLKRIRYLADRRVKQKGDCTTSTLRKLFIHWDHNSSGTLDIEQLSVALAQLGLPINRTESEELMKHYSTEGPSGEVGHEIAYADLVHDAAKGAPTLLEMHQGVTERLLGSSRSEDSLLNHAKPPREETAIIKAFRLKLQQMIEKRVQNEGGAPFRVLRDHFRKWDLEHSGTMSVEQLRGALRSLRIYISVPQANEVERFYSKRKRQNSEFDYMLLVQDICGPDLGPFVHHIEKKVRAVKHLGVQITDEEATATVKFYDPDGSGEMSYDLLWKELKHLSHSMLSYVEGVDVLKDLHHKIKVPKAVSRAVERIRAGVINAGQRMAGPSPSLLPSICPRDLLMDTCLRFNQNNDGIIGADELQKVWGELDIKLRRSHAAELVAWIEHDTNNAVRISDLCNTVFGEDGSNPSQSAASSRRQQPLPRPPKPRTLQAQRAAALANGKSSITALRPPTHFAASNGGYKSFPSLKQRQRGGHHGPAREQQPDALPPACKKVWNGRGRPTLEAEESKSWYAARLGVAERSPGPGDVSESRRVSTGVANGGVGLPSGTTRHAGGGESAAVKKLMIERRLRELELETLNLLRQKHEMEHSSRSHFPPRC